MNILLTEHSPIIDRFRIEKYISSEHTLFEIGESFDPESINALIIFGRRAINKEYLDQYPNVKALYRVGVGLDNVDLEYCKQQGIKVQNRPGSNAVAVAELAIRGMLSLLRNSVRAHMVCKDDGKIHDKAEFMGQEMHSQQIGFIGMGNIGQNIVERLIGFRPDALFYYEPHHMYLSSLPLRKLESVEEVMQESDILFLCLPLLPETRHMMNAERFSHCRKHVKLINTSRGWIIDEEVLHDFLKENPQAGAYLDVREGDPKMTDSLKKLLKLPNVVFTPHMATETEEALDAMHYFNDLA